MDRRFYSDAELAVDETVQLSGEESRHLKTVLRAQVGESVVLDGPGELLAELLHRRRDPPEPLAQQHPSELGAVAGGRSGTARPGQLQQLLGPLVVLPAMWPGHADRPWSRSER